MNEPNTTNREDVESAVILALAFEQDMLSGGKLTERPDAQTLLDGLQQVYPEVDRNGIIAKMFLCYEAGFDHGIEFAQRVQQQTPAPMTEDEFSDFVDQLTPEQRDGLYDVMVGLKKLF